MKITPNKINNEHCDYLTVGKVYETVVVSRDYHGKLISADIVDDYGDELYVVIDYCLYTRSNWLIVEEDSVGSKPSENKEPMCIGTISNCGFLLQIKVEGGKYFWAINDWADLETTWEEIPESLYVQLLKFELERNKE